MNYFRKYCIPCKKPLMDLYKNPTGSGYIAICSDAKCDVSSKIYKTRITKEEAELFEAQLGLKK